jgi:hypothetical protein
MKLRLVLNAVLIGCLLGPMGACGSESLCLEKLKHAVDEPCQSVSPEECRILRQQQLAKIKVWDAMTPSEKERAEGECGS